jgi:hypothetical protein
MGGEGEEHAIPEVEKGHPLRIWSDLAYQAVRREVGFLENQVGSILNLFVNSSRRQVKALYICVLGESRSEKA